MIIRGKSLQYKLNGRIFHFPMDVAMHYIGGKWKSTILMYLVIDTTLRFTDLKSRMPDITEKTLSLQLRALEADGLIRRKVSNQKPPFKVEYSLSPFGKTLTPALNRISNWGKNLAENEGELIEMNSRKVVRKRKAI